ncbi:lasso peptide biosynthesis B2 protein [Pseudomonadota bacterium]
MKNLSWLEWRIIMAASLLLPVCALCLRLWGLKRTQEMLCSDPTRPSDLPPEEAMAQALQIARAVDLTAMYGLYRANCLKRSLVLCRFLRGRCINCDLRIGADLSRGELFAHAWVEHAGIVLNDSPDVSERFATLGPDSDRKG